MKQHRGEREESKKVPRVRDAPSQQYTVYNEKCRTTLGKNKVQKYLYLKKITTINPLII